MAITPPNDNKGDFNSSNFAPEVWTDVQRTNNQIIDRNDMPFASTVEYKGYYKAESTGNHTFNLTGSTNVTGYSWVSSAPRSSDHIVEGGVEPVTLTTQKCYAIIIPNKRSGGYWPFEDPQVLGTSFRGYGYWPKSGGVPNDNYGNSTGWNRYFSGSNAPFTTCGYSGNQAPAHQYFLPGDIRTYGTNFPRFTGKNGGPSWQAPEDPNFSNPCWTGSPTSSAQRPLVRLENTFTNDYDAGAEPRTMGKTSQVFLDTSFKAEGTANDTFSIFESVLTDQDNVFVWPQQVNVYRTGQGKTRPERIQIRFTLRFNVADTYTFEWRCRDGLKIWSVGGGPNDARSFERLVPTAGANPCNLDSSNITQVGDDPQGWKPGGGTIDGTYAGFDSSQTVTRNSILQFHGYAVGVPGNNTHGFSLVVRDSAGNKVWTTEKLLVNAGSGLIGIDECGYHALLDDSERVASNKISEFYTLDGWKDYSSGDIFFADSAASDNIARSYDTTRQYLWSNSTAKLRGGTSIPGTVYLRQGDYYFIRTILSNHEDRPANYQFKVTPPTGGISQSVKFSGNGDPNSDSTVGGNAGGNGIPISVDALCDSVLAPGGVANPDTNFAYVREYGVILNLNELNVSDFEIGREGQAEQLSGPNESEDPGSKVITFANNGDDPSVNITLSRLVRGGENGLAPLTETERNAVFNTFNFQIGQGTTLPENTFSSAITSRAVIQWGTAGNYPYIYHVVSDVVNSICSGVDISVPVRPQGADTGATGGGGAGAGAGGGAGTGGDGGSLSRCLDINVSVLNSSQAQVTSECLDQCKTPNQYPMLESQYTEPAGYYDDVPDPIYEFYVKIEKDYGMVAPTQWSAPGPSTKGDYDISVAYAQKNSVKFEPEWVTTVPLTIPDVFVPDNFDITSSSNGALECSFWFELSSNTFLYDPNNKGDAIEGGTNRPYLVWWVSKGPGGIPLGDYFFTRPSYSTTPRMYATMNPEQWIYFQTQTNNSFKGYLGNTGGVRWLNFAPLQYQGVQDLNFNVPLPGTTAFLDLLSVKGYTSNEIRIKGTVTSPDCTAQSRTQSRTGADSSFRSAPDMIPYIGE